MSETESRKDQGHHFALAALSIAMFAGCSALPSAGDGERIILDRIKRHWGRQLS